MSVTQAVIAELSRPRSRTGHSYGTYLLVRWVWGKIGWWTMVPVSAIAALGMWAKSDLPAPRRKARYVPRGCRGGPGSRPRPGGR